jgi:hypothetical protein
METDKNKIKITEQITRRIWNWTGHTLRKEIEKKAMDWNTRAKEKRRWQRKI